LEGEVDAKANEEIVPASTRLAQIFLSDE